MRYSWYHMYNFYCLMYLPCLNKDDDDESNYRLGPLGAY